MALPEPQVVPDVPDVVAVDVNRWRQLQADSEELKVSTKVLAIVTERLMKLEKAESVVVSDDAMVAAPNLKAWREESGRRVVIVVWR